MNSTLLPALWKRPTIRFRMYLREMGTVPLLTREGEVEIAKRIERGQIRVLKALSRSAIVIREVLAIGDDLKRGVRSVKEVVVFDEEEITGEVLQGRLKEISGKIDELGRHYKRATPCREALRGRRSRQGQEEAARSPQAALGVGPRSGRGQPLHS